MNMHTHFFQIPGALQLEQGGQLPHPTLAFHTYGNPANPVVWVCHPLLAHSDVFEWWAGLFGPQDYFNPEQYFIVCANVLGSCFGSTGPLSENPGQGGAAYFHEFPQISIRDMATAHESLRAHLKINKIHLLIGAAMGGQQALEWAIQQPDVFENLVLIATNARHSAWGIAWHESQRMAIAADITWRKNHQQAGEAGLRAALSMALLADRNYQAYDQFQTDKEALTGDFKAAIYQQQQSEKHSRLFNAFSYFCLSQAMDAHHVGRNRENIAAALADIRAKTLVIGISSDLLFPAAEQRLLADKIPGAIYREVHSEYGHGAYLSETSRLKHLIRIFLAAENRETEVHIVNRES
jgi:homoserine O-acetyltransferase